MKYLTWLLKAAIFFTIFAFALNNQQAVTVYFFFGMLWRAPLVLVVLAAFAAGLAIGVLVMMPRWWRKRQLRPAAPDNIAPTLPNANRAVQADTLTSPPHGI